MRQGAYGWRLGRSFGLLTPPTLVGYTKGGLRLAVTEICHEVPGFGYATPIQPEHAYLIGLALRGVRHHELWLEGRARPTQPVATGWSCFYDLALSPVFRVADAFHPLVFYLPCIALAEAGRELGLPAISGLCYGRGESVDDPIIHHIGRSLLPVLGEVRRTNQLFIDHVLRALLIHVVQAYGGARQGSALRRWGLAPWQEMRAKELMRSRLAEGVPLVEVADVAGLSASAFVRAFKRSTGQTPHDWMQERRLEHALMLMSDQLLSLVDIARRAGFADEASLARKFLARFGALPSGWEKPR